MNCRRAESLLSNYIDNVLSARDTLEMDRHLAECNPCARLANETRRTVALLAEAPRFEVADDFMASLQARLSSVEQDPASSAWRETLRAIFRPRLRPAWGAALGVCALAGIILVRNFGPPLPTQGGQPAGPATFVQQAHTQSIAIIASDPFGDTAAASLAASISATGSQTGPAEGVAGDSVY